MTSGKQQVISKMRLDAKQLRVSEPTKADLKKIKRRQIYIICDNILDTYNIGAIFRLADAVAARGVFLCGQSETPPNSRIAKAAVGTEKWVPWKYFKTTPEAIKHLRKDQPKIKIVAIEQGKGSVDFKKVSYSEPVAFVVGYETTGVSPQVLKMCDEIVEIPMYGVNVSLNVMVSLAIVLFNKVGD